VSSGSCVVLGERAGDVRRQLGPLAWAALEVLVSHCTMVDGELIADSSVREVAVHLGVAKNTAHRAVRALRAAGLVSPIQRRDNDGRFLDGRYRLMVARDVLHIAPSSLTTNAPITARPRTRRNSTKPCVGIQLDLLSAE
jgi:hypothetical protein